MTGRHASPVPAQGDRVTRADRRRVQARCHRLLLAAEPAVSEQYLPRRAGPPLATGCAPPVLPVDVFYQPRMPRRRRAPETVRPCLSCGRAAVEMSARG